MSNSTSPEAVPAFSSDLTYTFGALFVSMLFSAVLFGITNLQAVIYFQNSWANPFMGYKFVVCWLWFLDAFQFILFAHYMYYYLVTNYANPLALPYLIWSFKLAILVDVLVIYSVHCLYAHRIWIIAKGKQKAIGAGIVLFIILASAVAISIIYEIYNCKAFVDLREKEWSIYMSLGTIAFTDVLIASSMCFLLSKSRTGFTRTDSTLSKLIAYTVNTGLLTSICSLLAIITFAAMPKNFVFVSIEMLLTKLYVNSFMAILNARHFTVSHEGSSSGGHVEAMEHPIYLTSSKRRKSQENLPKRGGAVSPLQQSLYYPPPSFSKDEFHGKDYPHPPKVLQVTVESESFVKNV